MTPDERIAELERQVLAQRKTIDALMRRVEEQDASGSTLVNLELERIVTERTDELRGQREALADSLDLWRAIATCLPDLLVQLDRTGAIVWSNRDGFGLRLGSPVTDFIADPDQRDRVMASVARVLCAAPDTTVSYDYVGSDDVRYSCRMAAVRHRGEVIGVVLIARDVTAQLQVESELRMATAQLLQGQKLAAIGQLAAGVAHEINTPIQFVSDNTVFVARSLDRLQPLFDLALQIAATGASGPDEVARLKAVATDARIGKIRRQIPRAMEQSLEGLGRVAKIVSAMKEFSHPSHGSKEPVDLRAALECTATIARNEWKYVADLEMDLDPALPPVPLLRDEFNQVVLNLLVNAAHAIAERFGDSGQRGTIRIQARQVRDDVVVRVSDDGNGIPEAIRHRVFEPFFTTKPVGMGTGQGLAIAYAVVVEKHGGQIELESELGRGTTFVLRLPMGTGAGRQGAVDAGVAG